jgi:hypothetical protein
MITGNLPYISLRMKKTCILLFIIANLTAHSQNTTHFPNHVGDISFDPALDDPSFNICDSQYIFQYYNTQSWYLDHKKEIARYFTENYKPSDTLHGTGYVTIRFVINCQGKTGRFRVFELDANYQPIHFQPQITGQLLRLTKQLTGWQPAKYNNRIMDSYQYIMFNIVNGRIRSISP